MLEHLEERTVLTAAVANPAAMAPPLSIVLVSDAVFQADQIRAAAANDTLVAVYDSQTMTTSRMVEMLSSFSADYHGARIGHLGIVTHGSPGQVEIGAGVSWNLDTLPNDATALDRLHSLLTVDARLDLYACSVAAGGDGKHVVDELAAATGAAVFASDNMVGSGPAGDFVWEYHAGQNSVMPELFSLEKLEQVSGLILPTGLPAPALSSPAKGASGVSSSAPTFNWSSVSGANAYRIVVARYQSDLPTGSATYGGSSVVLNTTTSNPSFAPGAGVLSDGTTYFWEVRAGNTSTGAGGSWSNQNSFSTVVAGLPAPAGLTATATGTNSIDIRWNTVNGASNYKLIRWNTATGSWQQIYNSSTPRYTDAGVQLQPNTTYYYQVAASNSSSVSTYAAIAQATTQNAAVAVPSKPTGLTATATGTNSIDIRWNTVSGASNYKLIRWDSATSSWKQIYWSSGTSYTDSGSQLQPNTTYSYAVAASNSSGDSSFADYVSATTLQGAPPTPTGLAATATGSNSVSIAWNSVRGASSYKLDRWDSATSSWKQIYWSSGTSYTDSGSQLQPNTTYYYTVAATNSGGDSSFADYVSATTLQGAPPTPTGLAATATGSNSVSIAWNSVRGASSYKLDRWDSATSSWKQIYWSSGTSYTDSGSQLQPNTTYYYTVAATNSGGDSSFASYVSATTKQAALSAPTTPTGLAATATGSNSVSIAWNSVRGASSYKLDRWDSATSSWKQIYWSSGTSYTDSGNQLQPNTTYYYTVAATNSGGDSSFASYVSATTKQGFSTTHVTLTAGQVFTKAQEGGAVPHPYHPSLGSGVTIGVGYDMGRRSFDSVVADLTAAGVDPSTAAKLAAGAGLTGSQADAFVANNKALAITDDQANVLYVAIYDGKAADVQRIVNETAVVQKYGPTDWDHLNQKIKDILVDMTYRGDYTVATRVSIQGYVAANDLAGFTQAVSNKTIFGNLSQSRFQARIDYLKQDAGHAVSFPLYMQNDRRWANDLMGGGDTLAKSGCFVSSIAMALAGNGITINGATATPKTLNAWLLTHGGYSGNLLDTSKIPNLSARISLQGRYHSGTALSVSTLKNYFAAGNKIVVANVRGGSHFVLLTGANGGTSFSCNDPMFSNTSYDYADIVGYAVYTVSY